LLQVSLPLQLIIYLMVSIMEEQIAVSIDRIKKIIDEINKGTFTTADI